MQTGKDGMEEIPVLIIGAGPAGLTRGLSLAKFGIRSIILEKNDLITDDPKGIYLAGDSVRIVWDLGIKEKEMREIGERKSPDHTRCRVSG